MGSGGSAFQTFTWTTTGIKQEVLDNAVVLTFMKVSAGSVPGVFSLPWHYDIYDFYVYSLELGKINIRVRLKDGGNLPNPTSWVDFAFRYVIIPGAIPNGTNRGQGVTGNKTGAVDFSAMSYEDLCTYFDIPG